MERKQRNSFKIKINASRDHFGRLSYFPKNKSSPRLHQKENSYFGSTLVVLGLVLERQHAFLSGNKGNCTA